MDHLCPLCRRPLVPGPSVNKHHLLPKTYGGKEVVVLHRVCHRKIHATFTDQELARHYHTIERLQDHPEIARFVAWVAKKDPEFYDGSRDTARLRRGRRRQR